MSAEQSYTREQIEAAMLNVYNACAGPAQQIDAIKAYMGAFVNVLFVPAVVQEPKGKSKRAK